MKLRLLTNAVWELEIQLSGPLLIFSRRRVTILI